jgi:hypothetical protein
MRKNLKHDGLDTGGNPGCFCQNDLPPAMKNLAVNLALKPAP